MLVGRADGTCPGGWPAIPGGAVAWARLPQPSASLVGVLRIVGEPPSLCFGAGARPLRGPGHGGYLVDSASSHMLVSKIKPCMSKYKRSYRETANGSLNQLSFI